MAIVLTRRGLGSVTGASSKRITTRVGRCAELELCRAPLEGKCEEGMSCSGLADRRGSAAAAYVTGVGCGELDVGAVVGVVVMAGGAGMVQLVVVAVGKGVVEAACEMKWLRAWVTCTVCVVNKGVAAQRVVCIKVRVASAESRWDSRWW
jgi:hypothetical protein